MKHSPIGASSATRWMNCPGSIRMNKDKKSTTSRFASEGTAAHDICEQALNMGIDHTEVFQNFINKKVVADDIEFTVDQEMTDAVKLYVRTVRDDCEPGTDLMVEKGFKLKHLHPDLWGTNDACVSQEFGVLRVYDFKYGKGVAVDVEENAQLMYYAVGAMESMCDCESVELIIVQPRARHKDGAVRRWMTTPETIIEFGSKLKTAALATEQPDAELASGDWCGFCPSLGSCPEVKRKNSEIAKSDFAVVDKKSLPNSESLSNEELSTILRAEDIFKKWLKAVAIEAQQRAEKGEEIPRCKMVRSVTRRKWKDEKTVGKDLHAIIGDSAYVQKPITLTQAEKYMKPLYEKEVIDEKLKATLGETRRWHNSSTRGRS